MAQSVGRDYSPRPRSEIFEVLSNPRSRTTSLYDRLGNEGKGVILLSSGTKNSALACYTYYISLEDLDSLNGLVIGTKEEFLPSMKGFGRGLPIYLRFRGAITLGKFQSTKTIQEHSCFRDTLILPSI